MEKTKKRLVRLPMRKVARTEELPFEDFSELLALVGKNCIKLSNADNAVLLFDDSLEAPNRAICDGTKVQDIIYGDAMIIGTRGNELVSLTEKQAERYERMFYLPEKFYSLGGTLGIIPFTPAKEVIE